MPPFAGFGLRFFISTKLFAALSFEYDVFFEGHYIKNTKRYDKTEAISSQGFEPKVETADHKNPL